MHRPFVLFYHFFAVAFYSMYVMFSSMNPLLWPKGLFDSLGVLYKACAVILPYMFSEMRQ